jgi:hypothetical protein
VEVNERMDSVQQREVVCRIYAEGDEYGIVELFNNCFDRKMTLEEWMWKYRGQGNRRVYAVVLEDREKGIVGHYGGVPLRMIRDGHEIKGVGAGDTMIHPQFRSFVRLKNMYHLFMEELLKDSVIMFYGFPPKNVARLTIDRLRIYERVETVYDAVKDARFDKGPVRLLYRLFPVSFDDARIDELWHDVQDEFGLAIIRDRAYFTWRYKENPLFKYEAWALARRWSGKLTALAIVKREQSGRLLVTDLVFHRSALSPLITKVENLAMSTGMAELSLWLPQRFHDLLREKGFSLSDSGATLPRSAHPHTIKKDEIQAKFFFTMGDTDFI